MRFDAAQIDCLAAEYVLGTLHGASRRRFDRLIAEKADVRFVVWEWERYLNDLALGVVPKRPPQNVWRNISDRIGYSARPKRGVFERWRGFWIALPTAAAVAWLTLSVFPPVVQDRVAVFADQAVATMWVISADFDTGRLQTETVNAPTIAPDSSYELWILRGNEPPLSLGLLSLNPGSIETTISPDLIAALSTSGQLAISLEPAGGSPTGLPTGPVVYQAALVTI